MIARTLVLPSLCDHHPSIVGFNVAYNALDFTRISVGYGQITEFRLSFTNQAIKILSALTILSLLSTACSNMSFKKDEEKTAVVKRVAVVAFANTQPITSGEGIIGSLTGTRNSNQPFNPALCTEEKL